MTDSDGKSANQLPNSGVTIQAFQSLIREMYIEKDQARGQTAAVSRDEGPDGPVVFDQHHALGESSSMDLQVEKRIVAR